MLDLTYHKYAAQYGGQILGHYTNPGCAANSVVFAYGAAQGAVPIGHVPPGARDGFCGVAVGAAIALTLSDCLATAGRRQ